MGVGSSFPFFNRHQLEATRFLQLSPEDTDAPQRPPWAAVLHAK